MGVCGVGGVKGISEMEFKFKAKEKKDSINTAGCIAVVFDFTDSIFLSLPSPIHPYRACAAKEHYHSPTH